MQALEEKLAAAVASCTAAESRVVLEEQRRLAAEEALCRSEELTASLRSELILLSQAST